MYFFVEHLVMKMCSLSFLVQSPEVVYFRVGLMYFSLNWDLSGETAHSVGAVDLM